MRNWIIGILVAIIVIFGGWFIITRFISADASSTGDMNADGVIDEKDLSKVISEWGETKKDSVLSRPHTVGEEDLSNVISKMEK